jgi:hypothetical protein
VPQTKAASSGSSSRASSSGNAHGVIGAVGGAGRTVVKSFSFPIASALAGAAAGLALKQRQAKRRKQVLGVSIPGTGGGSDGLARNVGEAAKQLARLADELRTGRQKAEEIGRALR